MKTIKPLKYGVISIGLIYVIGFTITLFSEIFRDLYAFSIYGILVMMLMLFANKIIPFLPFLLLVYFVCYFLVNKKKVQFHLAIFIVLILYIVFGVSVWKGEFFSLFRLKPGNTFSQWWVSETISWHFSIASSLALIFFVWMTFYKKERISSSLSKDEGKNSITS